jgi:hypothetical protein
MRKRTEQEEYVLTTFDLEIRKRNVVVEVPDTTELSSKKK